MSAVLQAHGLVRRLAGEVPVTLVDGVDIAVQAGEFVAVMGPSGSGKSSLLYLLGLLDAPDAGRIRLDGDVADGLGEEQLAALRLRKLGFVFQFHFLLAEFTALDNVALPMRRLGRLDEAQARERALELLARLELRDLADRHPGQLSGGQRQRVAVARALANDPPVILADEPTGNLDSVSSETVRDIFVELAHTSGKAIVAVTHDADFAVAADRCIGLVDGRESAGWMAAHPVSERRRKQASVPS